MSGPQLFSPTHSQNDLSQAIHFEPRWYAAYTYARHEKRVAEHLQRIGVESYLALHTATRQWNQRRAQVELPLFPGYVFVRIPLAERLRVLSAPGVAYLVGTGGQPVPLADEDVEPLRDCLSQKLQAEPVAYLSAGRRVRVVSGPLSGLEGVIVRREGDTRFVVSIELIMRAIAIKVEGLDLELIEPSAMPAQGTLRVGRNANW
ncbi:MAG: UpxY family transcription antiterminator [Candidatus Korobacteraceae bacterium]|jgi:transcription antitermination factor NusG